MKKLILFIFISGLFVFANGATYADDLTQIAPAGPAAFETTSILGDGTQSVGTDAPLIITPESIATDTAPDVPQTECASRAFANALGATANKVTETDPETIIQSWIYTNFGDGDTIKKVLACPEIIAVVDDATVKFSPIIYDFPNGRHIVINYETQPKILKQRLLVAEKRALPDTNPSPKIGAPNDGTIWTNTEPAWYGILVVESGSLDKFIGGEKNNTLSLKYLEQNIDTFFPRGAKCTSRSALANDDEMINRAAKQSINITDDTNDYYVAGDVSLEWITWAQVGLDIAITVATVGGGTVVLGATKMTRATKAARGLATTMKTLEKSDTVKDFIKLSTQSARLADDIKKLDKTRDAAQIASKSDEIKGITTTIRELEKADDVKQYKNAATSFEDVMKLRRAMRGIKSKQTGNVIARSWRALRTINSGNKTINQGAKIARAGMKSGRARDWLFHSTLKNIGKLAKIERAGGIIYGALTLAQNAYDWSETSTGEFTNGLEFKPLGLLSADDLQGAENVVNHGMWFMWLGDSTNPADDDAAYLQAMDFAAKFHQDLNEINSDNGNHCAVDIFVVRPILRNPGDADAAIYYLIMNDVPWTVSGK